MARTHLTLRSVAAACVVLAALASSACGDGAAAGGHRIAGHVAQDGFDIGGLTVELRRDGSRVATATTDVNGAYAFGHVADGTYAVVPGHETFVFQPASRDVAVAGADVAGQDFTVHQTYAVSGRILGPAAAFPATVALTGAASASGATDGSGAYRLDRLLPGTYTVTPSREGYKFWPASREIEVVDGEAEAGFSVAPSDATVTIDAVELWQGQTNVAIGGYGSYIAVITNWTGTAQAGVSIQRWVEQGTAQRAAGGGPVLCTDVYGDLPAGTSPACNGVFSVSNANGGDGTLVPGPATLVVELRVPPFDDGVEATARIPITLVSP